MIVKSMDAAPPEKSIDASCNNKKGDDYEVPH